MRARIVLLVTALTLVSCGKDDPPTAPAPILPGRILSYPSVGGGADDVTRGFFVPEYPGTSLASATVWLSAPVSGAHTVRLIARSDTYDGAVVDSATRTVALTGNATVHTKVTFNFGNRPVAKRTRVTFILTYIAGPSSSLSYDVHGSYGGLSGTALDLIQTQGQSPPLDSFRRFGVALQLDGLE